MLCILSMSAPPLAYNVLQLLIRLYIQQIRFVTGDAEKRKSIGPVVDPEQATEAMLPEGMLSNEIDVERSLSELPFHALYDK